MIKLAFDRPAVAPLNILCLGAHSDDIEIGCGGAILQLLARYPQAHITWVVFSATGVRAQEAACSAEAFTAGASSRTILLKEFTDSYFPYIGAEIKDCFNTLKLEQHPDLIFTHCRSDLHQDHRLICDLTWNSFRDHLILEYEIPKYDGDLGSPNLYIALDQVICEKKIQLLLQNFQTQSNRQWFTPDTFRSILHLRGLEAPAPSKFAEAFYCRKINL